MEVLEAQFIEGCWVVLAVYALAVLRLFEKSCHMIVGWVKFHRGVGNCSCLLKKS